MMSFFISTTMAALISVPTFAMTCKKTLESKVSKAPTTLYETILSTDLDFLRTEARFAEGPSPQKNMAMVSLQDQFRVNRETETILKLKKRLTARNRSKLINVQAGQEQAVLLAVREQFTRMLEELPIMAPDIYKKEHTELTNLLTQEKVTLTELNAITDAKTALEKIGQLVPDDLILMKKSETTGEFHLIGGYLAFPTHWNVDYFLGASITKIHVNVGETPEKSVAFAQMINRVLGRTLETQQVVRRNNWFTELDPRYPLPNYLSVPYKTPERIDKSNYKEAVFVRAERQTLRGLPESQVVVFAIQPFVFSVGQIMTDKALTQNLLDGINVKLLPSDNTNYLKPVVQLLEKASKL